jgi:hypothetical protein
MTKQHDSRSRSLRKLLSSALGRDFTDDLLTKVIDAEDEMTENREHLVILQQRGVLSDEEFAAKLNTCFEVFIQQATEILGEDVCRKIYDYGPGDKIDLVPPVEAQETKENMTDTPVPVYVALANAPTGADAEAIVQFLEANSGDFETYTLSPPPPGYTLKAAFDYVLWLKVAASAATMARLLWMAYDKFIAPKVNGSHDGAHIYVVIPKPDGRNAEYRIDNLQSDKEVFVHDFEATVAELQKAPGARKASTEAEAEIKHSGMWVRRK